MKMSDNTYKKYQSYTVEELLQDDFFISSMTDPTDETEAFWLKAVEEEVISLHDYKLARYYILSVQVRPETISLEETYDLWSSIEVANKENIRNKKKRLVLYLSAAAGTAALLALMLVVRTLSPADISEGIVVMDIGSIQPPEQATADIQLILAGNEAISLEGKEAEIAYHTNGIAINNEATTFSNAPTDQSHYNQLVVPFGKRSMLTLEEGTKIWVNAGTRIVHPVTFHAKQREIYIDGEAYLEVAKDAKRPFIVKTREMSVRVLGTAFNIMAYEKDTIQNVVLVEGSVQVHSSGKKETILSPNEMFLFANGKQEIKEVNIEDYISWKNGIYQYESEYLGTIMQRLSRYYGEEIVCSLSASRLPCSGKLDLKEDLRQVLNGITHTVPVTYSYDGQTYRITNE